MCGCSGGNRQQQQRAKANLQSPRRALNSPRQNANAQAAPKTSEMTAERRRIQQIHQEAIRKRFNRH